MAWHDRCETFAIEARHPEGNGVAVAPPDLLRGRRITLPLGDGQKGGRTRPPALPGHGATGSGARASFVPHRSTRAAAPSVVSTSATSQPVTSPIWQTSCQMTH